MVPQEKEGPLTLLALCSAVRLGSSPGPPAPVPDSGTRRRGSVSRTPCRLMSSGHGMEPDLPPSYLTKMSQEQQESRCLPVRF